MSDNGANMVSWVLNGEAVESPADFLTEQDVAGGFFVPVNLVQPIRSRLTIDLQVEGLCFTFPQIPHEFAVTRPESVRQLGAAGAALVDAFARKADCIRTMAQLLACWLKGWPSA